MLTTKNREYLSAVEPMAIAPAAAATKADLPMTEGYCDKTRLTAQRRMACK
jgi:hypothetical protein